MENKNLEDKKTKVINFRLSKTKKDQLDEAKNKLDLSQSEILRLAVDNIIKEALK